MKIPLLREYTARRLSSSPDALVRLLAGSDDAIRLDPFCADFDAGLFGAKKVQPPPPGWPDAFRKLQQSADKNVREQLFHVALIFDDPEAFRVARNLVGDVKEDTALRHLLHGLVQKRDPETLTTLMFLTERQDMRGPVLRGLAAYSDGKTPATILGLYKTLTPGEKTDAVNTLASRLSYATAHRGRS